MHGKNSDKRSERGEVKLKVKSKYAQVLVRM